ncbi:unnamed protein product, partial [Scytosiphon promiscuus]
PSRNLWLDRESRECRCSASNSFPPHCPTGSVPACSHEQANREDAAGGAAATAAHPPAQERKKGPGREERDGIPQRRELRPLHPPDLPQPPNSSPRALLGEAEGGGRQGRETRPPPQEEALPLGEGAGQRL